jgi:type IV pilus assembly protein PilO
MWAVAGVFAAAALLVVGWFLFIGPQQSETRALRDQVTAAHDQTASLHRRLIELRRQKEDMPRYEAELAANRKALPATPNTPDFVRQLQAAGDAVDVSVSGISVGEPADEKGSGVFTVSVTLDATGSATQLEAFLDQLQRVQPRAVLVNTATVSKAGDEETTDLLLNAGLDVFVAPTVGGK